MQAVELYNPRFPNLHLIPFSSGYSISDNMNPLNYQLAADDFIILTQADGQVTYSLNLSTTTSLFWALHRLAWHITRATSHGLHTDPTIPFASKGYIPQIYFDCINMQRPAILAIQTTTFSIHCMGIPREKTSLPGIVTFKRSDASQFNGSRQHGDKRFS